MSKSHLEEVISEAASQFALRIVEVLKSATLEEMMEMQRTAGSSKPARAAAAPAPASAPAAPHTPAEPKATAVSRKKKRVVKNYPKCAYPGCEKNRFPRGKGFCGEHWRAWEAGQIKDAENYR